MVSAELRDDVFDLASIDWRSAILITERITDPWYAAQAMTACARFAPSPDSDALIKKSFQLASSCKDAYQRLAVSAWPLRALVELGRTEQAALKFETQSIIAPEVEPLSSRSEACFLVFQALAIGPAELGIKALHWMTSVLQPGKQWRQTRALRDAMIQAVSIGLIQETDIHQLINDEKLTTQILDGLARGERNEPRSFFRNRYS